MLKIIAKLDQYGVMKTQVVGLAARSGVELRVQNTMSGKTLVLTSDANQDGVAPVSLQDFGQYYAITARLLNGENDELLFPMHFTDVASDGTSFVMECDREIASIPAAPPESAVETAPDLPEPQQTNIPAQRR